MTNMDLSVSYSFSFFLKQECEHQLFNMWSLLMYYVYQRGDNMFFWHIYRSTETQCGELYLRSCAQEISSTLEYNLVDKILNFKLTL